MMQAITQHSIAVNPSALKSICVENILVFFQKKVSVVCVQFYLGTVGLDGVVNVDENKEYCHQQSHAARDDFWINKKTEKNI